MDLTGALSGGRNQAAITLPEKSVQIIEKHYLGFNYYGLIAILNQFI